MILILKPYYYHFILFCVVICCDYSLCSGVRSRDSILRAAVLKREERGGCISEEVILLLSAHEEKVVFLMLVSFPCLNKLANFFDEPFTVDWVSFQNL